MRERAGGAYWGKKGREEPSPYSTMIGSSAAALLAVVLASVLPAGNAQPGNDKTPCTEHDMHLYCILSTRVRLLRGMPVACL